MIQKTKRRAQSAIWRKRADDEMPEQSDKTQKNSVKRRFAIDHSAKFYPIMSTKKAQSLFCISADMFDDVQKDVLKNALNDVLCRFPAYKVKLKRGWAWHFFEQNDAHADRKSVV